MKLNFVGLLIAVNVSANAGENLTCHFPNMKLQAVASSEIYSVILDEFTNLVYFID